jgi:hypothetical protein
MLRYRQENEKVLAFTRDLERLAYWMLVTKVGINQRIERFSRLTAAIESGDSLDSSDSPLQLSAGEQFTMYTQLNGPLYDSLAARARSALLLRLDALLSGGGATYEYDTVTVEHVLPQNPPDGSTWLDWFPDTNERTVWVHRLGNLALLTRKKNSSASNFEFDAKKRSYFSIDGVSPFAITTQVLSYNRWTPDIVAHRQTQLIGEFETHWRLENRKADETTRAPSAISDPHAPSMPRLARKTKRFLIGVTTAEDGLEFFPLKEWLRQNPGSVPEGLNASTSTSHMLRDGLRRVGWTVQEFEEEVRLLQPKQKASPEPPAEPETIAGQA